MTKYHLKPLPIYPPIICNSNQFYRNKYIYIYK